MAESGADKELTDLLVEIAAGNADWLLKASDKIAQYQPISQRRLLKMPDLRKALIALVGEPPVKPLPLVKIVYRGTSNWDKISVAPDCSLEAFKAKVEASFVQCIMEEYDLEAAGRPITDTATLHQALMCARKDAPEPVVLVIPTSQAFSSVTREEGLRHLGVPEQNFLTDHALFKEAALVVEDKLAKHLQDSLGLETVGQLLHHLGVDIACRCLAVSEVGNEQGLRELISPLLFAAATLVGDVTVAAMFNITGHKAHGKVDWDLLCNLYSLVLVEATQANPLDVDEWVGQLGSEMKAGREEYTHKKLGRKRKYEDVDALRSVPSFGVITNGSYWCLFKYDPGATGVNYLYRSEIMHLKLTKGMTAVQAFSEALPVVKRLVHVLQQQQEAIVALDKAAAEATVTRSGA